MPFQYSCFVSYRHTTGSKGKMYTERIVDEIKEELEFQVSQQVFLDVERLRGPQFYNEALASALCQSVCMVVLYWPTYFSEEHTFCAREFKAMLDLEAKRIQALTDQAEKVNSLIIIIALRNFDLIPAEIKAGRLYYDFEPFTKKRNMRLDPDFQAKCLEISQYIAGRVRAFQRVTSDLSTGCTSFRLPAEQDVVPWLRQFVQPPQPLPTRGPTS